MAVKSAPIRIAAAKKTAAAPVQNRKGRAVKKIPLPNLRVLPMAAQRRESKSSWAHRQPMRAVNSRSMVQAVRLHSPDDSFEKEADQVADKVVDNRKIRASRISRTSSRTQRKCAACQKEEQEAAEKTIQCKCASCGNEEKESIQTKRSDPDKQNASDPLQSSDNSPPAGKHHKRSHTLSKLLVQQPSRGSPLPDAVRSDMEHKFGADFSRVKIHSGNSSNEANKALGARAFTQGKDIHFANGEYDPGSSKGRHLLAHELTHTIQQGASPLKSDAGHDTKETLQPTKTAAVTEKNNTATDKSDVGASPPTNAIKKLSADQQKEKKQGSKPAVPGGGKPLPGGAVKSGGGGGPGKTAPKSVAGGAVNSPNISEEQPLSSISGFSPTRIGKGLSQAQQSESAGISKYSRQMVNDLPKVPLASGSAYAGKISKHKKSYSDPGQAKQLDGTLGKNGFQNPKLPDTKVPEPPPFTPVSLPATDASGKDEVNANKANKTLDAVTLNTNGIPERMNEHPQVELTGEADPGNMDEAQQEQGSEIDKAKAASAKEIWLDYGENNVIKDPGKGKLSAKKKPRPLSISPRPVSKNNSYPDYFESKAAAHSNGDPYRKIDTATSKYYTEKQTEKDKITEEDEACRQKIDEQANSSRQNQEAAQSRVLKQVNSERKQWNDDLEKADRDFYTQAAGEKKRLNDQINEKKQKGDADVQEKIDEANKEAAKEHQQAHDEVEAERQRKKNESKGFWGWVRKKASALINALKSFVNKVFDKLRKAVKWIFDKVKKVIVGILEVIHKAVVGLIKGFGAFLKGLANIALAAFPSIRRRVVKAIDEYVDKAVEATDKAFAKFEKMVSDFIDALADFVDKCLAIIQKIVNIAFDVLNAIITGLLYVLEFIFSIEKQYQTFKRMIEGLMYLWDHPEVVEQKVKEFLQPYISNVPAEAPAQIKKALTQFGLNIAKHVSGVMTYLLPNLKHLAANWWGEAKKMIWFLVWPFAEGSPLWEDAPKLWHLIPQIWNDFWSGNFSSCIDGCLEWMQALNSVVGAFAGWIVIGSVLVGAIIGAFFGGAGALPGAGAGLEVGLAAGEGIMASMIGTETAVILKAVYDLSVTTDDGVTSTPAAQKAAEEAQKESTEAQAEGKGPTMRKSGDIKTGRDRIEYAYQRIANSGFALGIMVALILLGAIGGKIAQGLVSAAKRLGSFIGEMAPELAAGVGKVFTTVKESKFGTAVAKGAGEFNAGRVEMKGKIESVKAKVGLGKGKPGKKGAPEEKPVAGNDNGGTVPKDDPVAVKKGEEPVNTETTTKENKSPPADEHANQPATETKQAPKEDPVQAKTNETKGTPNEEPMPAEKAVPDERPANVTPEEFNDGIRAKEPTHDGHEIKVNEQGRVIKCSECNFVDFEKNPYKENLTKADQEKFSAEWKSIMDEKKPKIKAKRAAEFDAKLDQALKERLSGGAYAAKQKGYPPAPDGYQWNVKGDGEPYISRNPNTSATADQLVFDKENNKFVKPEDLPKPERVVEKLPYKTQAELEEIAKGLDPAKKGKLESNTLEHKAAAWEEYKNRPNKNPKDFDSWSNTYDANMNNALRGNKIANEVHAELGWGEREYTLEIGGEKRRLDIADPEAKMGVEVKAYESGKVELSDDIRREVRLDSALQKPPLKWKIEWIFRDCEPSAGLKKMLDDAGIKVTIQKTI